jgi:hypothetical protein
MHPDAWWMNDKLWATVIGVLLGFFISETKEWLMRRRHRKAHWAVLRTEVELCREAAVTYLRDNIAPPLFRLPTLAVENSLPALLAGAWLKEEDAMVLFEFFSEVDTLNRGLSQAQSVKEKEKNELLAEEYGRNRMKTERLIPGNAGTLTLYDRVKAVIARNLC